MQASGAREAFRLLKEKGLGRECKFVLVSGLVECKPSANKGDQCGHPTGIKQTRLSERGGYPGNLDSW